MSARSSDPIVERLRTFYEAEAEGRLRPGHGERRHRIAIDFARRLAAGGVPWVLDLGAGPASDRMPFEERGVGYVGADLAVGNARLAAETGGSVIPSSLFELPIRPGVVPAGWSMSTLQHVPDRRFDEAMREFVRVLRPGADVVIGLWGGRDEVVESEFATTGLRLPRHFTLRRHDRIDELIGEHLDLRASEAFPAGPSDWEYHVVWASAPA